MRHKKEYVKFKFFCLVFLNENHLKKIIVAKFSKRKNMEIKIRGKKAICTYSITNQ